MTLCLGSKVLREADRFLDMSKEKIGQRVDLAALFRGAGMRLPPIPNLLSKMVAPNDVSSILSQLSLSPHLFPIFFSPLIPRPLLSP